MDGIDVQVTPGPDTFRVSVAPPQGAPFFLARDDRDALEIEELAYGRLLSECARPLPAGAIAVRVCEADAAGRPTNQEVAVEVARALARQCGGWSTWR